MANTESTEGSAQPLPETTSTTEAPPPGVNGDDAALARARELLDIETRSAQLAQDRAEELRAAAQEAEQAASKLADAAEAAEEANNPSALSIILGATLWAAAGTLVSWGLYKLLERATGPVERPERFPRGTEEATTEPTTAQIAQASA